MGIIVDTNVFIAQERERRTLNLGAITPDDTLYISAITASELLVGVHRAESPARKAKRLAFVEAILSRFPILPVDTQVARVHAHLLAEQMGQGAKIGAHDLLIAATAVTHGFGVLTEGVADFSRVNALTVYAAIRLGGE